MALYLAQKLARTPHTTYTTIDSIQCSVLATLHTYDMFQWDLIPVLIRSLCVHIAPANKYPYNTLHIQNIITHSECRISRYKDISLYLAQCHGVYALSIIIGWHTINPHSISSCSQYLSVLSCLYTSYSTSMIIIILLLWQKHKSDLFVQCPTIWNALRCIYSRCGVICLEGCGIGSGLVLNTIWILYVCVCDVNWMGEVAIWSYITFRCEMTLSVCIIM